MGGEGAEGIGKANNGKQPKITQTLMFSCAFLSIQLTQTLIRLCVFCLLMVIPTMDLPLFSRS